MELNIWYFLAVLPGIGSAKIKQLLDHFPDPHQILAADKRDLGQCSLLTQKDVETIILYSRNSDKIRQDFTKLQEEKIRFVGRTDPEFPKELLYCRLFRMSVQKLVTRKEKNHAQIPIIYFSISHVK